MRSSRRSARVGWARSTRPRTHGSTVPSPLRYFPPDWPRDPEFRQRFDREAKAISQLSHAHICTLYDVGEHEGTGAANFDVARDGRLIYADSKGIPNDRSIVWVARSGQDTPTGAPLRSYLYAQASPDGTRLSLDIRDQSPGIWIWDVRGTLTRLTSKASAGQYGIWSPDGQRLFATATGAQMGIFQIRASAMGDPEIIVEKPLAYPNAVSPDGKMLIFRAPGAGGNDLFVVPLSGKHVVKPLLAPARGITAGVPAALFSTAGYFFGGVGRNYDVLPDGNRFIMVKNPPAATTGSTPITVVLNWLDDVRARVVSK